MRVSLFLAFTMGLLFSDEAALESAVLEAQQNPKIIVENPLKEELSETLAQDDLLESLSPDSSIPELFAQANKLLNKSSTKQDESQEGYTINYNTVSIIEYIRFASKICKVNFIYEEADLDFSVTIVSDEPITPANVMATLIQVLRVHGLRLLEQGNNLVIHKSTEVKQVATLVTQSEEEGNSPIITRIFRVRNARPGSVAAIIQPMISASAILEVSPETNQLILTDITANVNKIAALIENLDSPHSFLEIGKYGTKNNSPIFLINLATQIMTPIAQGNPFILVPQSLASEIYIVSTPELVENTLKILQDLDSIPKGKVKKSKTEPEDVFVYKIIHRSGKEVLKGLMNIGENLQLSHAKDLDLIETIESAKWIQQNNSIILIGTSSSINKAKEFLSSLDVPQKEESSKFKTSFFIFKPQHKSAKEVQKAILELGSNLKGSANKKLIEVIHSVKINPLTKSLSFSGDEKFFPKTKELLATIDVASTKKTPTPAVNNQFFIYKPTYETGEELLESLKELTPQLKANKLSDPNLLNALDTMKWVKSTNSLLFTGTPSSLTKIQSIIATIDVPNLKHAQKNFFQYHPKYADEKKTESYLNQIVKNLAKKGGSQSLIKTLQSYKWIPESNSFMFYGSENNLNQVKILLAAFDNPESGLQKKAHTFYQYRLKYADREKAESYLSKIAQNLTQNKGSQSLIETLKSYKWIPESKSFMFYGSENNLDHIKIILAEFDTPDAETVSKAKPGYYLYKVQNTSAEIIEDDLDQLAKNLKATGVKDPDLIDVIQKIRYVKQTNSLLLSGNPKAIEQVKELIKHYDYPRKEAPTKNDSFYTYKPLNIPGNRVQKSLKEIADNLKKAGLANPNLLKSISDSKYVSSTNTLIFAGSSDTLEKIKNLIKEIDIAPATHTPIQHIGKTTFLLYKLKNADGAQIVSSIKKMASELRRAGNPDKNFIKTLNSIRYIKETRSLFFSGSEESLKKAQNLVEKFDVTGLVKPKLPKTAPKTPLSSSDNFWIYKPQSLKGIELETILQSFSEQLKSSGLIDPNLFQAIDSMRYDETTKTLVFTGSTKALERIKELLKEFDIPSNTKKETIATPAPAIQAIDNTSFLVYKLQFHKGEEIQTALKQIARDLIGANAPVNQSLLNSINSIQWLEVTNSLLCSGDQDTLTRLRELIKNLDIPLKQVFIEMLVLQTNLTNALNFGLEWGGTYKYRNKFGTGMYNSQPINTDGSPSSFLQNLQAFTPSTSDPSPNTDIPISSGFDLGVIGEVIRHNGDTFLTLGSLLSALQTDDETAVIMTPKILAQDGRTSTIFVGDNIPYVGSFVQNSGANVVNTSNLEYRDVGFNLTITPVLGNSDIVTLDINLDRSETATNITGSAVDFSSLSAQGIITTKTTMETTVHVPNNNFLILSGMINNSNAKTKAGIPCLGGLPLVGAAFSKNADTISNTNIVIFIRPHIINSVQDMRKITSKEEEYFRDQQASPFLERNFDDAMELIKTIDDE